MLINPVGPVVESAHGYNSVMASHGYRYIEIVIEIIVYEIIIGCLEIVLYRDRVSKDRVVFRDRVV